MTPRSSAIAWLKLACLVFVVGTQQVRLVHADELQENKRIETETRIAWYKNDIAGIERFSRELRSANQRTSGGVWQKAVFYETVQQIIASGNWQNAESKSDTELLDGWKQTYPESPTPIILKALLLRWQGRNARTFAAMDRPPLAGWKPEIEHLVSAKRLLEENRDLANSDPHWHVALIHVLGEQGASVDDLLLAHQEALQKAPAYDPIHTAAYDHLVSRWNHDPTRIEQFANTASIADVTQYARLYVHAYTTQFEPNTFHRSGAGWSKLKAGMLRLTAQHPTPRNTSYLALFSCLYGDRPALAKAFGSMDLAPVREVWREQRVFSACKLAALE